MRLITWSESTSAHIGNIEGFLSPQGLPRHAPEGVLQLQHLSWQIYPVADPVTVPELLVQPLLPKQTGPDPLTYDKSDLTSVCSSRTRCSRAPPGGTAPSPPPWLCRGRRGSCSPQCRRPAADLGDWGGRHRGHRPAEASCPSWSAKFVDKWGIGSYFN